MLCQNCNENEANVKYTQIINGVKKQMNLCEKCARELGIDDISFSMPMDFSNFLGNMFENDLGDLMPSFTKPETLLCEKCGSSYEDFIQNGKFGCNSCYDTFETQIDNLLKKIHGVNRHIGRNGRLLGKVEKQQERTEKVKPKMEESKQKLEQLKEKLKQEIKEERYEDAAKTRDEIKKIGEIK